MQIRTEVLHDTDIQKDTDVSDPDCEDFARSRILLAEDGECIQRLILFMLERLGVEFTLAENGQIAVELALRAVSEKRSFDLILMDMQMPVLDGYAATRRLRSAGYTGNIVAVTAVSHQDDVRACFQAGCDDHLAKPFDQNQLLALLRKYA